MSRKKLECTDLQPKKLVHNDHTVSSDVLINKNASLFDSALRNEEQGSLESLSLEREAARIRD
jgi:hypothetical protein